MLLTIYDRIRTVIGETIVTPSAIVYLLVKLRISPPGTRRAETKELSVDEMKRVLESDHEIDEKFLESRLDAEENSGLRTTGSAHAPHWPGVGFLRLLESVPFQFPFS